MWTRLYLGLVLVRLYFALSPSYIHPDENFQGPEVVAGTIFSYPYHSTWEFDPSKPIRSYFALFPVYGLPLHILHYLWTGITSSPVPPRVAFYVLRGIMFLLSFVLEDWAVHELVSSPQHRRTVLIMVASSYVTWTHQAHTFSNSVETLVVLWCLVLVRRILETKQRSHGIASFMLGFLLVYGTFNRITFPVWVLAPCLSLLPHFRRKPLTFLMLTFSAFITAFAALATDTAFYYPQSTLRSALQALLQHPIITPLNSLLYNANSSNLATHGLHPRITHFTINLPQLLGPALVLLVPQFLRYPRTFFTNPQPSLSLAALVGTSLLSAVPHQEARFLLPAIPLLLASVYLPISRTQRRVFLGCWILFNVALGLLFGVYHQGGVLPMQLALGEKYHALTAGTRAAVEVEVGGCWNALQGGNHTTEVLWWRTYSPPVWLLDSAGDGAGGEDGSGGALMTRDLMGMPAAEVRALLAEKAGTCDAEVWFVAPDASVEVEWWQTKVVEWDAEKQVDVTRKELKRDSKEVPEEALMELVWRRLHTERRHVGLDDMDFAEDGVLGTLTRVVGKRGLTAWRVGLCCPQQG